MNQLAWNVALAVSSVIVGVTSLWALFRPMAAGTARKAADRLKQDLKSNEFHEVGVRFERLDASVNDRIDRLATQVNGRIDGLGTHINGRIDGLDTHVNGRIDRLEARLTAAMAETRTEMRAEFGSVRAELNQMHETQGRILEAIRTLSPVGNQG